MPKKSFGPVKLSSKAHTKSFPVALNDVAIDKDSRLGQWQELNSRKTISHLIDNLISTGAIENIEKIDIIIIDDKSQVPPNQDVIKKYISYN